MRVVTAGDAFQTFVQTHAGLSRDELLARIGAPHLAVTWLAPQEGDSADLGVFTIVPDAPEAAMPQPDGSWRLLLPVAKRSGANGFTGMITLGRATNNDLVIKHRQISKFHAYFRAVSGKWAIHDAASTNGTWVDGRRAPPERGVPLRSGSTLVFGSDAVNATFLTPEALADLVESARR
jgi:hypothetical protein